jgi:hypothetical protein
MAEAPKLIGEFLSELEDPHKLKAYLDDPEKVLRESGLTDEQRETLRSNDHARIREAIREEYKDAEVLLFMVIAAPMVILSPPKD